jgi:hypothetical protein
LILRSYDFSPCQSSELVLNTAKLGRQTDINMQIWSISYTTDKFKAKNRCWLQGKLNYNTAKGMAHFYDEDNMEFGKLKLRADQIKADAEFSLGKHLIELGVLEGEEECVEDLFERLNKELGIEEFQSKNKKIEFESMANITKRASVSRTIQKPKIPSKVESSEALDLYDILYTRDLSKKTKTWHDGLMKYHAKLKLAEFHDSTGILILKKTMDEVKEGGVVEGAAVVIEICSLRSDDMKDQSKTVLNTEKVKESEIIKADHNNLYCKSHDNLTDKAKDNNLIYSILYTADKHKKAKKWVDGQLNYDPSSHLAKFMDEGGGNCFYKKVMREGEIVVGEELQSGLYIFQIDHLIQKSNDTSNISCPPQIQPQAKRIKSVVADESVPLEGRSNEQLLSLLKSRIQNTEIQKKEQ